MRLWVGEVMEITTEIRKPHVSNNSGNNEWYTPPVFIDSARVVMGRIDLDPASSAVANKTVMADRYFTSQDDGLAQDWHGRVWLNPPYAQPLVRQVAEALVRKFERGDVSQACVLVNNATETVWFQTLLTTSSAVCLMRSRIRFLDPSGKPRKSPLQGQVVIYFGSAVQEFVREFSKHGACLASHHPHAITAATTSAG